MKPLIEACALLALSTFSSIVPATGTPTEQSEVPQRQSNPSSLYGTRFANVSWNNERWQLTTTNLDQGHYQSRLAIANGYIGINVAALGPFFEVDTPVDGDVISGWPLFSRRQTFATVGGFWDSQPTTNGTNFEWMNQYGGESVISGIPHWGGILVQVEDHVLNASTDASEVSGFSSTLDLKQGLAKWTFTWTPSISTGPLELVYHLFAHKLYVNQAFIQLEITASKDVNATLVNVLDGDAAVRTTYSDKGEDDGMIFSAVKPNGIDNVTAYVYAGLEGTSGPASITSPSGVIGQNDSSIAQSFNVALSAGHKVTVTKYVGIASSDGFSDPQTVARTAATTAMENGFNASLSSHVDEWAYIFTADSVDDFSYPGNGSLPEDDFIIEQAITAVTNPYYLLQNTIGENALAATGNASINSNSIAVGGLASDSYAGLIFWDAEVWMQPGLVAAFPQAAQGIANYRLQRFSQARQNAQTAYTSSKNSTTFSPEAAAFPWTSGRFGNCTGTGPCFDYEYHINGDIAQELVNYWVASGDTLRFQEDYFPIYDAIAHFYSELLENNGSRYALTNMTDPDEYANNVDNGGFTMALISDTLTNANNFRALFGSEQNSTWQTQAQNVLLSRNDDVGITLEFTSMNGSISVKQADVVLITYPLRYEVNYTSADALDDLDYYAAKQSSDGPGMTYAIFSIVANEVSPSGCSSYTYHQYSTQPYARAPWFQLSEQLIDDYTTNGGTHPAFPFLTGHGGANQVVLFGYLGFRLVPDFNLHVDPSLPPQISQIRYRTFYWQGWPISAFSNSTHTTLTRLQTPLSTANMTFSSAPIPVLIGRTDSSNYILPPNSTLTIPNRLSGFNLTLPGNLVQCSTVTSPSSYVPGQFPISAIDGASSTKWQPSSANETASITIKVPSVGQRVKAIYFDWGNLVPNVFSLTFFNSSSPYTYGNDEAAVTVASDYNVRITSPFNASQQSDITPPTSNISWFVTDGQDLYAPEYATLTIRGNQAYGRDQAFNASLAGASVGEFAILGEDSTVLVKRDSSRPPAFTFPRPHEQERQWSRWIREIDDPTTSVFAGRRDAQGTGTADVSVDRTRSRSRNRRTVPATGGIHEKLEMLDRWDAVRRVRGRRDV